MFWNCQCLTDTCVQVCQRESCCTSIKTFQTIQGHQWFFNGCLLRPCMPSNHSCCNRLKDNTCKLSNLCKGSWSRGKFGGSVYIVWWFRVCTLSVDLSSCLFVRGGWEGHFGHRGPLCSSNLARAAFWPKRGVTDDEGLCLIRWQKCQNLALVRVSKTHCAISYRGQCLTGKMIGRPD